MDIWNLKYNTNELIYKIETDSQTQRTDLWLLRVRGIGEGWIGNLGSADANYSIQMDKQEGPIMQCRNYIQYPVIHHNGKEYEK